MSTYCFIKSKLDGHVIDIQGASTKSGVLLDAFPQKATGNNNQLWELIRDPAASGYYFIKSRLSGNVIDIQGASTKSGVLLDAFPQKATGNDNQLWKFIKDPAGSGYCFIKSKLSGNVIDIQGASTKSGVLLDVFPQKATGNENQLWMAVGEASPELPSSLSFTNLGTGSNTTSSGSTECSYTVNLTIQKDGTCHFWGSYTNRGDVPIITAPNQTFGVSIVVFDTHGKGYSFSRGGNVPSAPQSGCTLTWDNTQKAQAIIDNWGEIVARHYADYGYHNDVGILDFLSEIGSAVESIASTVGTVVSDVATVAALV
ncbi:MAG: RICIN domain-containing protein [Stellaceae bacterium]